MSKIPASEYMEYDKFIKDAEPRKDISDLYPPTIFKRPCSNCENEDSINICDQCCFRYDSWFKKKEESNSEKSSY